MTEKQVDDHSSPLKVVHVIGGGEFGGAEQHIIQLLSLLPEHDVAGKVICFYEAGLSQALRERGIEVKVLQFGRFDLRLFFALRKVLKQAEPDIIHTHGVKANFFTRLAARSLTSTPLITTVHSVLRFDYINRLTYMVASLMERRTRKHNDHFIAVSETIKASLTEDGVAPRDVTVVHNGIDAKRYADGNDQLRSDLALPEGAKIIGIVTRLVKIKGLAYLIGAMPRIVAHNPLARLVILGTGPEEAELRHLVDKLGLQEQVIFTGFRDDVAACLGSFDYYVSASLSEGLPLNVLEAMAASLPIVATNVGGIPLIVEDRHSALLVKPSSSDALADGVIELMDHPELAERLAQEAQLHVAQHFSPERMAQETVAIYDAVIKEKQGLSAERRNV